MEKGQRATSAVKEAGCVASCRAGQRCCGAGFVLTSARWFSSTPSAGRNAGILDRGGKRASDTLLPICSRGFHRARIALTAVITAMSTYAPSTGATTGGRWRAALITHHAASTRACFHRLARQPPIGIRPGTRYVACCFGAAGQPLVSLDIQQLTCRGAAAVTMTNTGARSGGCLLVATGAPVTPGRESSSAACCWRQFDAGV